MAYDESGAKLSVGRPSSGPLVPGGPTVSGLIGRLSASCEKEKKKEVSSENKSGTCLYATFLYTPATTSYNPTPA